MTKIQLDLKDRLILANQCKILEALYPDEQEHYATARKVFEDGLEWEYDTCLGPITQEPVPEEVSEEVYDILSMYSDLRRGFDELTDKSGIEPRRLTFEGFDRNKDFSHLTCADFILQQGKYDWLKIPKGLNSHSSSTLGMYQRMLSAWRSLRKPEPLSKTEIQSILAEQLHPERRPAAGVGS